VRNNRLSVKNYGKAVVFSSFEFELRPKQLIPTLHIKRNKMTFEQEDGDATGEPATNWS